MPIPTDGKKRKDSAPCRGARQLLLLAAIASVLMVLTITADLMLRTSHQDRHTPAWIQAFNLSAPALWHAGTSARHPETMHPGVNLRFGAGLENVP